MNPFSAQKNLLPFLFTFFHLSYQPFTSLYFADHANHTYNSLHFNFYCLNFPLTGYHFTNPRFENTITPSGSWFQSVMDLFTKSTSRCLFFVFWLWYSNNDRPYFSSLAPVTYPLSPSTPFHRYTLCRTHTCVLSSYAAPKIPSPSLPNDAQI